MLYVYSKLMARVLKELIKLQNGIFISARYISEIMEYLELVLITIQKIKLTLKFIKYKLAYNTVLFLRFMIFCNGLSRSGERIFRNQNTNMSYSDSEFSPVS